MSISYAAEVEFKNHPAIPSILLERVLFSDYKLVSTDGVKQVFKRVSVLNTVAFLSAGGSWEESPTKLTIKFLALPEKTKVSFQWELTDPFEQITDEGKKSYKAWIDNQLKDFINYVEQWLKAGEGLQNIGDGS